MPDYYLKFLGGAAHVDAFVGLAPVVHGTDVADPLMVQEVTGALGFGPAEAQALGAICAACRNSPPARRSPRNLMPVASPSPVCATPRS